MEKVGFGCTTTRPPQVALGSAVTPGTFLCTARMMGFSASFTKLTSMGEGKEVGPRREAPGLEVEATLQPRLL